MRALKSVEEAAGASGNLALDGEELHPRRKAQACATGPTGTFGRRRIGAAGYKRKYRRSKRIAAEPCVGGLISSASARRPC
jgi:hypothetical protein